ncbi:MAG: hypothetical protein H6739_18000 [Alphaproteobacteria bacterium]|nr:hypothetical protein [Alphaproteobacteria bacterium]
MSGRITRLSPTLLVEGGRLTVGFEGLAAPPAAVALRGPAPIEARLDRVRFSDAALTVPPQPVPPGEVWTLWVHLLDAAGQDCCPPRVVELCAKDWNGG